MQGMGNSISIEQTGVRLKMPTLYIPATGPQLYLWTHR